MTILHSLFTMKCTENTSRDHVLGVKQSRQHVDPHTECPGNGDPPELPSKLLLEGLLPPRLPVQQLPLQVALAVHGAFHSVHQGGASILSSWKLHGCDRRVRDGHNHDLSGSVPLLLGVYGNGGYKPLTSELTSLQMNEWTLHYIALYPKLCRSNGEPVHPPLPCSTLNDAASPLHHYTHPTGATVVKGQEIICLLNIEDD